MTDATQHPIPSNVADPAYPADLAGTSEDDAGVSLLDILLVLLMHKRLLAVVPLACGVLMLAISFLIPPVYTASAQMLPPQQAQSSAVTALLGAAGGMAGALGSVAGLKNPNDQWVALLRSRPVVDRIIAEFGLREVYDTRHQTDARRELAERTRIVAGKDNMILVEVEDVVPERAARIANRYISALQDLTRTLAVTEAAQRRLFFERQLQETRDRLVQAEVALKDSGVGPDVLKTSPAAAVGRLAQVQANIAALEVRLSGLRQSMTEFHPETQRVAAELQSLRAQLKDLARVEGQAAGGGRGKDDYIARYREFKYFETLHELFARQFEMAKADEASNGAMLQVVAPAEPPDLKSRPRRALLALTAVFVALVACLAWVLARWSLSRVAQDPAGAEKLAALRAALGWGRGSPPASYNPRASSNPS